MTIQRGEKQKQIKLIGWEYKENFLQLQKIKKKF